MEAEKRLEAERKAMELEVLSSSICEIHLLPFYTQHTLPFYTTPTSLCLLLFDTQAFFT